jgi:Flp pilus assembly pilin Flp
MTEYIVLVGLIAILLIGAVTKFKDALGKAFDAATSKVDSSITQQINGGGGAGGGGAPAANPGG